MHTPDEAIDELEFVTKQLGSKVGMFGSNMARKVPPGPPPRAALPRRIRDGAEMRRYRAAVCDQPIYVVVNLFKTSSTRRLISSRNSS